MRKINPTPSKEYLDECLDYDPNTGILTWKVRPLEHFKNLRGQRVFNTQFSGKEAFIGKDIHNAKIGWINGRFYFAHRIIWKIMTGEEPPLVIDHKDQNPSNNRWENLREATNSQNGMNAKMKSNNTSGIRGVCSYKGKWMVQIRGYRGVYCTLEEAKQVAQRIFLEEFNEYCPDYVKDIV